MRSKESLESASASQDNPVEVEQLRTRDQIFKSVGNVVDLSADTAAFAAWNVGRGGRGFIDSLGALYRGAMKKSFHQSA